MFCCYYYYYRYFLYVHLLQVCIVKAMILPVVTYRCERWTTKKAEHWRIDAFELWLWKRLLRAPWTTRRSNQSTLREINPDYSSGRILMLKFQSFGHLMWRANSLEKTLMAGRIEGIRRRGQQKMRWLYGSPTQWTWIWANSRRQWRTGKPSVLQSMGSQSQTQFSDWTTTCVRHPGECSPTLFSF